MPTEAQVTAVGTYNSLYFDYVHHAFQRAPELDGKSRLYPVIIAGAGPVGMTVALDLARRGIEVVLLEEDDTVNRGSRAVGIARRSLEIFERAGAGSGIFETGVSWKGGQSYYRDSLVLDFVVQQADNLKHPPMVSIAQCNVEQYLYDALQNHPKASIRWSSKVVSARQDGNEVIATVATPHGDYDMRGAWLVACDGGRSAIRKALGKELKGSSYEGRYLIVDIQMKSSQPSGRRVWFAPPEFPGSTIIMHKQPFDIWRIDYQLGPDDDLDEEVQPRRVRERVDRFLKSIGETADWAIDWISPYRALSLSLDSYREGRVLFAGDAAHLVPIFGARGMNGGVDDANNLAWKLAYVVSGWCDDALLDSYSSERVDAAHQNMAFAEKSTRFMTPPTFGHAVLQEAILSLAVKEPFIRDLINPRQVTELRMTAGPLRFDDADDIRFAGGPLPGAVCPNLPLCTDGPGDHLQGRLGRDFTLLLFHKTDTAAAQDMRALVQSMKIPFGFDVVQIRDAGLYAAFDAQDGTAYLIRPDGHVAGRWRQFDAGAMLDKLLKAIRWKNTECRHVD
ncbi:MAG: FAD-dependent monooxygenase [Pseudolabrys sp.]|nr:FAD-dependent monooxygenase [Pseudolabrys sp.]